MRATTSQWSEIELPQLAESVVDATIIKWLKQPGDPVEEYEAICEIMTDKVNAELPSTASGILKEIVVQEGETVAVGTVICRVDTGTASDGAEHSVGPASAAPQSGPSVSEPAGDQSMRHRYSPAVRRLADEHGLDLSRIQGSGMGGRITRKDVLASIANGSLNGAADKSPTGHVPQQPAASAVSRPEQTPNVPSPEAARSNSHVPVRSSGLHLSAAPKIPDIEMEGGGGGGRETYVDITPIRNTIASRMRQSVTEIPHAWTMIEVDVTNLVVLRNKLKDEFKRREGVNLTYLAFLLKAVVNAIKDYPIMNSVWAVDKIIVKRDINISLAVGTEDSILTPVIKQADQKNVAGLAREIEELATKTRNGKLQPADMAGGTFTVNNTGSFGSILSYPIINYPQAVNLTFESIVKKPVVIDDMIAVRSMVNICLSLDHRILDGVICGRFLQRVKENLEAYGPDSKVY